MHIYSRVEFHLIFQVSLSFFSLVLLFNLHFTHWSILHCISKSHSYTFCLAAGSSLSFITWKVIKRMNNFEKKHNLISNHPLKSQIKGFCSQLSFLIFFKMRELIYVYILTNLKYNTYLPRLSRLRVLNKLVKFT